MPEELTLHAELNINTVDSGRTTAVSREWLICGYGLFNELHRSLENVEVGLALAESDPDQIMPKRYSQSTWSEIIDMQDGRPAYTLLQAERVVDGARSFLFRSQISTLANQDSIRLVVDNATSLDAAADPSYCAKWFDFIYSCATGADPAWGVVTDDNLTLNTSLDMALRRPFTKSIPQSRDFLRGYSWITVCPEELLQKLGGVNSIYESGAFHRVQKLATGGVVLQATETLLQYDDFAMRKAFLALARILPPGLPKYMPGYKQIRVVYEDAANFPG